MSKPIKHCEHGKRRYCRDCNVSAFCEHGKRKQRCRQCGGSAFCEHERIKERCKECNGSSLCEHEKRKDNCRECNGSSFCEHQTRKNQCKSCLGSQICEHMKVKQQCRDCFGTAFCIHEKRKTQCRECFGSVFCEHEKRKNHCKSCHGSVICEHGKYKHRCKPCGGGSLCKNSWCETIKNSKYEGYCMACFVNNPENQHKPAMRNYKTKEKDVVDQITQTFTNFTWIADKRVQDGCSLRRPDLLLDMGSHIIIVEIDEHAHTDYDCSCEHKRLMELSRDLSHRPIVFIRFNPDEYTNQDGVFVKSCWRLNKLGVVCVMKTKRKEWEERIETLKQQIQYWIDNPTEKTIEIVELFY